MTQRNFNNFNFASAFGSWENQKGFPVINVAVNNVTRQFVITQERYYDISETRVVSDDRSWFIPLNFVTALDPNFDDTSFTDYFVNGATTKTISFPSQLSTENWFIFNKQQIGYYRVNYDTSNWNALAKFLNSANFKQIHVLNRAQIIDDALNLAADGYLHYQVTFEILSYLSRETDYIPWQAAARNLDKLESIMKDSAIYESFKTFVRKLVKRMHAKYGFDEKPGDTVVDKYARELAIDWTCRMDDDHCVVETFRKARDMALNGLTVPPSLEIAYICNGLRGLGKQEEFTAFFRRMQVSNDQSERLRIMDGLVCSSDPELILSLLETTIVSDAETYYRTHEIRRIVSNVVAKSSVGVAVMIDFLTTFYADFVNT